MATTSFRKLKNMGTTLLTSMWITAVGLCLILLEEAEWVGMVLVPLPWVLLLVFCFNKRQGATVPVSHEQDPCSKEFAPCNSSKFVYPVICRGSCSNATCCSHYYSSCCRHSKRSFIVNGVLARLGSWEPIKRLTDTNRGETEAEDQDGEKKVVVAVMGSEE